MLHLVQLVVLHLKMWRLPTVAIILAVLVAAVHPLVADQADLH
jgi:hypothetical protein